MAGKRFLFDAQFTPLDIRRRLKPLRAEALDVNRYREQGVTIPAGKSQVIALDDELVAVATDLKLIFISSSIEGVSWWPIDSASPNVDPDTKLFGPLLDHGIQQYEHVHGARSSGATDHDPANANKKTMFSTLPALIECAEDVAAGGGSNGASLSGSWIATTVAPPTVMRPYAGKAMQWDSKVTGLGTLDARTVSLFLGPDAPWNLGVTNDQLGFTLYCSISDTTKLYDDAGDVAHRYCLLSYFLSHPFTSNYPQRAFIPALTPLNVTPFGANDPLLCANATVGGGANYCGWSYLNVNQRTNAATMFRSVKMKADLPFVNGYKNFWLPKSGYSLVESNPAYGFAGSPLWNRITAMIWQVQANATMVNNLIQVYFGPQPGRLYDCYPYAALTDQPWSVGSVPAVGVQNPTAQDAQVMLAYGTI